ncbi:MAG: recombinase RecA [Candidatus Marinimicrobia bacterium]|nr:recombinase RecA [Candidatus Neomarinimicrobiota bacterium]
MAKAKNDGVNQALRDIEAKFGKGAAMRLGSKGAVADIEVISTGVLSLDEALGCGGVPRGRIIEVYGPESSGKTTLALHVVANAQKDGGQAAFVDAEHALDPKYAGQLGVDTKNLVISQPDSGEQALEIVEMLVKSNEMSVIVVDSVAALTPRAELEGEMGASHVGLQARLMSQALRKLSGITSKSRTTIIFINQLREKIGVTWGSPETTTGGRALKFYASIRMDIRRIGAVGDKADKTGNKTRVKVVKNKMAPPFKEVELDIMFGEGFSYEADLINLALKGGIISKSGSWLSYGDDRLGNGMEAVKAFLKENTDVRDMITSDVRKFLGMESVLK